MENVKAGSERPKGAGRRFSLSPEPNGDPTPPGASSQTRSVSDRIQLRNITIRPSGEAAVVGPGLRRSLVLSPSNRPLEKAEKDGRGDLDV